MATVDNETLVMEDINRTALKVKVLLDELTRRSRTRGYDPVYQFSIDPEPVMMITADELRYVVSIGC